VQKGTLATGGWAATWGTEMFAAFVSAAPTWIALITRRVGPARVTRLSPDQHGAGDTLVRRVAYLLGRGIYDGSHTRVPSRLKSCRYLQLAGVIVARLERAVRWVSKVNFGPTPKSAVVQLLLYRMRVLLVAAAFGRNIAPMDVTSLHQREPSKKQSRNLKPNPNLFAEHRTKRYSPACMSAKDHTMTFRRFRRQTG
jgi:hypothetical protein